MQIISLDVFGSSDPSGLCVINMGFRQDLTLIILTWRLLWFYFVDVFKDCDEDGPIVSFARTDTDAEFGGGG